MALKLAVLFLLTFTGLGYPPWLGKAQSLANGTTILCISCGGTVQDFIEVGCDSKTEVACPADDGCKVIKDTTGEGDGFISRSCGFKKAYHECVRNKFGERGQCLKGSISKYTQHQKECSKEGKMRVAKGNRSAQVDDTKQVAHHVGGQAQDTEICQCYTERCNEPDITSTANGTGAGTLVKPNRKLTGISGVIGLVAAVAVGKGLKF